MYTIIKYILKSIFPARTIFRYEEKIRWFYAVFYSGKKHKCTVCSKQLSRFVLLKNGDGLCPFCGSLPRHRKLWTYINTTIQPGNVVLHFSPARCLQRRLRKNKNITYLSTDFEGEFPTDHHFDITNIALKDNSSDVIICYHVLEHIENDLQAMHELHRVLKQNGIAIIQTPFKSGETYENPSITDPEEREQHFGQKDHVRIYSLNGLQQRLEAVHFKVQSKHYKEDHYHGLSEEIIVTAIKKT